MTTHVPTTPEGRARLRAAVDRVLAWLPEERRAEAQARYFAPVVRALNAAEGRDRARRVAQLAALNGCA